MNEVFSPNLYSGSIPSKPPRNLGHLILEILGISDLEILSEIDLEIMNRDLSRIMFSEILSPREHLIQLGVYSITEHSINRDRFKQVMQFSKENRLMDRDSFAENLLLASKKK